MSTISFSGLATGIDTDTLISQLVAIARIPIDNMETEVATLQSKSSKFSALDTKAESLQSKLTELNTAAKVLTNKGSSSNESVLKVGSVTGDAATGAYTLSNITLAAAERRISNTYASDTAAAGFGNGQLSIQYGSGSVYYLNVDSSDSLQSVKGKIDALGIEGITTSVVNTGSAYVLQLSGRDAGATNAITISATAGSTNTGLELTDASHRVQAATNASFTIDGLTYSRSSNTITDAINGVTFDLLSNHTTGNIQLSVTRDTDAITAKVQSFVDAYNSLSNSLASEFKYSGTQKSADSLSGDTTAQGLQRVLRNEVGRGVNFPDSIYNSLSSLGITTARDGSLAFNSSTFQTALQNEPDAVAAIFAGSSSLGLTGIASQFESALKNYTQSSTGFLANRIDGLADRVKNTNTAIEKALDRLEKYEDSLKKQYASLEATVSQLQAQGQQLTSALAGLGG